LNDVMIQVTKTYLPPIDEYMAQVKRAFDNAWLTNRGELIIELERKISEYLRFSDTKMICMNNGTVPLQIAVKLLAKGGEVITTPFSYVATTASIVWENCTPVFVDIHPEFLTIDETLIEAAITERTTCILATHVFGNPCNIEELERIAKKHGLYVIYDAAHCFGVNYKGKSIFEYGDVSTCSFHATKLFHTGEGGAVFCKDEQLYQKLFYSHNFGHNGPLDFHGLGINGKISELQAAMGLAVLPYVQDIMKERSELTRYYDEHIHFGSIRKMKLRAGVNWNYSYYPIVFDSESALLVAMERLREKDVFPRRYFFPSLNTINYAKGTKMSVSENTAASIICLPLFAGLSKRDAEVISETINAAIA
jgi:dTDP-4-amino-4,6-dideoxygalactose transaminase